MSVVAPYINKPQTCCISSFKSVFIYEAYITVLNNVMCIRKSESVV